MTPMTPHIKYTHHSSFSTAMLEDLAQEDRTGSEIKVHPHVSQVTKYPSHLTILVSSQTLGSGRLLPLQAVQGHGGGRILRPRKTIFSEGMKAKQDGALGEDGPLPGPGSNYRGSSDSNEDDEDEEEYTFPDNLQKKRKVGEGRAAPAT
ncbi:hypothetical protein M378DRAFT_16288 [Amanita muscaria Koide BX008]|uniref:Uncharacterized protein n=1 Tax=Amanita muscaria (strain Koide BX008) TaxID=946122 RepID=A0A0C2WL14_AMAMK|nr:hypothetical protein M378DRAFT_16288 [Amanita muscaria Koide BX008]